MYIKRCRVSNIDIERMIYAWIECEFIYDFLYETVRLEKSDV